MSKKVKSCLIIVIFVPFLTCFAVTIDQNLKNVSKTIDINDSWSNSSDFNDTNDEIPSVSIEFLYTNNITEDKYENERNTTVFVPGTEDKYEEERNTTRFTHRKPKSWLSRSNWNLKLMKNESLSSIVTPSYSGIQLDDKSNSLVVQLVGGGNSKDGKEFVPCRKPARCEPMNRTFCYGTTLNYKGTSFDLINDTETTSHSDIQRLLSVWNNLRNFPKCWSVVQNLLCAVLVPRCEHGVVDLPNLEMCRVTRGPCRMVEATVGWPSFLRCDNEENFPHLCKAEARELRFASNSNCPPPLVTTDLSSSWYDGWEGCGLDCHDPLFTKAEHKEMHLFIGIGSGLCLIFSLFTVMTFFIDWKSANKYPALIIFYINWCFLIASIGWLAQFTPGARDDIVCRRDGTLRKFEPSSGENLSCVIVFVMIYYFSMAASIWFVMLTYSWYVSFKVLGKIREAIDAKTAYFHLVAWSLPLVLTITILALAQVDGDSISGICFVGHSNTYMRIGFVLVPITIFLAIGGFYLVRAFVVLVRLKIGSEDLISVKASAKLRDTIIRIAAFAALVFLFVVTTYVCHIYEYTNREEWNISLRRYVACKSNLTQSVLGGGDGNDECVLEERPNLAMVQLHLLCVFGSGIVMSTWVWTSSTFDAWKRFLRRAFDQPINEPVKLTKHKMIAKAFAKRRDMRGSRLSFSFQSTHDDPLGMNFDFNSCASQEISSTWQAALPKFITRRGAFMGAGALGLRRNSSASEASQMRQSVDSRYTRRHSLDSQISFHMSDRERRAYMVQARQQRRKKKRRNRGTFSSSQVIPWAAQAFEQQRRGSDASQQSDFGPVLSQQFLASMKMNNIEKEARQLENSKTKRSKSSFLLPINLLSRQKKSSGQSKRSSGRRNFGFIRGLDTSSEDGGEVSKKLATEEKLNNVPLPGQIGGDDIDMKAHGSSAAFKSKRKVADDTRSVVSTDNESLHKLGEQLSSSILLRAMRDSQSDLEMGTLNRNYSKAGSNRSKKSQIVGESTLNNSRRSGRNTIVDLAMDSDNRDSSSS